MTPMKAPTHPRDPADVSVQIQFRAPFWYRETLFKLAREHDMNLSEYVLYVINRAVPPVKPKSKS